MTVDLSGHWKRTSVGDGYDEFWKAQGHGWVKRKLASNAPLHREIIQEGNQVKKDHQVFAGLINVDSSYPIHASKDEAAEARKNGDTIKEEANGKTAHLVAYFDGDALVLHRTFVGETFEVLYIHRKNGDDTIELELHCINGDKTIKSSVVFSRHEHHHLPHLHHDKDKQ